MPHQCIHLVNNGYRYCDYLTQSTRLLQQFGSELTREEIGRSVLGKAIDAWSIGKGKEQVHINAAVHANEWITTPLLMRFIEHLALERSELECLERVTLHAVPMVNPDGVDLSQEGIPDGYANRDQLLEWNEGETSFQRWKANIRGVDLNDQFPAFWDEERTRRGRMGPAWQDYSGPYPLSEPEAIALSEFTRKRDFNRVMSLHTQGREIYWNYRDMEPQGTEIMANHLAEVSGYRAVKLSDSDAGYKDWFIYEFRRPGFTIEAGLGANPLPAEQFNTIFKEILPLLHSFIQGMS